jgi:hypothetical protein
LADSDCSQKFSAADSGENFIRSDLRLIGRGTGFHLGRGLISTQPNAD